ncbi:hypothetical protein FGADI_169 [Fusarium gaditjirri]|uniref:Uncharacterized protein n=1 Tax=Fusarium gaditjirri TaxID=282569 RepID=A0A8H4TPA6_9HYPO|nr:hypothetical protein FGADI_169 [Fusarium gaditjirri]
MCHTVITRAFCGKCKTPRDEKSFPDIKNKQECQEVKDSKECKVETSEIKENFITVCPDCESSSDDDECYNYGSTPFKNPPK